MLVPCQLMVQADRQTDITRDRRTWKLQVSLCPASEDHLDFGLTGEECYSREWIHQSAAQRGESDLCLWMKKSLRSVSGQEEEISVKHPSFTAESWRIWRKTAHLCNS